MSSAYKSILKATGLLGSVQVLYTFISIVRNKLAAIFIGPYGMGLLDLYTRIAELCSQCTNFGLAFSAVRELSQIRESGTKKQQAECVKLIRSWGFNAAILGTLACVVFAPLLCKMATDDINLTYSVMRLSPLVGILTLTGCELAILKAMRRLRQLANNTVIGALLTLIFATVFYPTLGVSGIKWVLLLSTGSILLVNMYSTTRLFPYHLNLTSWKFLKNGGPLIKLGMAYVISGAFAAIAEIIIRDVIIAEKGMSCAGLYAAGLTLTVSYARIVLTALDADYFPRLSALTSQGADVSGTINDQIDILLLLMSPFLMLFSLALPQIIQLLYTPKFLDVLPMVICALSSMYFKAMYSPLAYLPLAKGDSRVFMVMELLYDVVFCASVVLGFHYYGLLGAGVGLSLSHLLDLLTLNVFYHVHYGYRLRRKTFLIALSQYLLLTVVLGLCIYGDVTLCIAGGTLIFAISTAISLYCLKPKFYTSHKKL